MLIYKVTELARRMRSALETLPQDRLPITMSAFPADCCEDVSLLLGAYFVDSGVFGFERVCGDRGNEQDNTWISHAWLARGSLIVDITADQFGDSPGKIIVSEGSVWHSTFEAETGQPSDFRDLSGPGTYHLHTVYGYLRSSLFSDFLNA